MTASLIDLSTMKSVRVDAANRTVRVDPGCTSRDVNHATHAFGLAVPFGIVSTTGIAGLPDEAIDTHIAQADVAPSDLCLMHFYPIDGAVHGVARDATPCSPLSRQSPK
jgi:hypothetical protein